VKNIDKETNRQERQGQKGKKEERRKRYRIFTNDLGLL
jgi:hypothetical protein